MNNNKETRTKIEKIFKDANLQVVDKPHLQAVLEEFTNNYKEILQEVIEKQNKGELVDLDLDPNSRSTLLESDVFVKNHASDLGSYKVE